MTEKKEKKDLKIPIKESTPVKVDTVIKLDHYIEIKGLNQYDAALLRSQPSLRNKTKSDANWNKVLVDLQKKPITN